MEENSGNSHKKERERSFGMRNDIEDGGDQEIERMGEGKTGHHGGYRGYRENRKKREIRRPKRVFTEDEGRLKAEALFEDLGADAEKKESETSTELQNDKISISDEINEEIYEKTEQIEENDREETAGLPLKMEESDNGDGGDDGTEGRAEGDGEGGDKSEKSHRGVAVLLTAVSAICLASGILIMAAVIGSSNKAEIIYEDTDTEIADTLEDTEKEDDTEAMANENMEERELSASDIYSSVIDGVVSISVKREDGAGIGSGFFISEDGYIATAAHVVEGSERIRVILSSGREYVAEAVASDSFTDVALLKVKGKGFKPLRFGSSEALLTGETVHAIGTPASLEYAGSLTSGEVSFSKRTVKLYDGNGVLNKKMTLIQTNAQVNPGNSGCPLINSVGEVVGMITMKLGQEYAGIGFALPADGVETMLSAMIEGKEIGWEIREGIASPIAKIGIAAEEISGGEVGGLRISGFTNSECSAAKMLRVGDIITELEGVRISTAEEWTERINAYKPGDKVAVTVYRSSQYLTFSVTLY